MKFVRSYHVAQLGRNVIKPTLLQVAVVRPESNFINAYEGLLKYGLEVAHFERNKWLTLERNMHLTVTTKLTRFLDTYVNENKLGLVGVKKMMILLHAMTTNPTFVFL